VNTIYLQTFSWITDALGISGNVSHIVEKKVEADATLSTVFNDLAQAYPEFKKLVYDPDSGKLSDKVMLIINQRLARFDQVKASPLKDKDEISLVPVYVGG
jgi:molybdopterin converting factor small subunit